MSENTIFSSVSNRELDRLQALVSTAKTKKLQSEREQAVKQYIASAEFVLIFADNYIRVFNSAKTLRRFLRHHNSKVKYLTKTINDKNQHIWSHALAFSNEKKRVTNKTEIRDFEIEIEKLFSAKAEKESSKTK